MNGLATRFLITEEVPMSDEMEIMEWFDSLEISDIIAEGESKTGGFRRGLKANVQRERDKAKCEVVREILTDAIPSINPDLFAFLEKQLRPYIAKYSPAPRYCEGMQEAIDNKMIDVQHGKFYISQIGKPMHIFTRCPFCEEGKNCIGGKG